MNQARRFMSYVNVWVVLCFVLLMAATAVLLHSFGHSSNSMAEDNTLNPSVKDTQRSMGSVASTIEDEPEQIILVPMENISELWDQHRRQQEAPNLQLGFHQDHHSQVSANHNHGLHRVLLELRQDFESWVEHHQKRYHSADEKERRFTIWAQNHHR